MRIEEITSGSSLTGLEPSVVATVIAVVPIADGAVRVIYQMSHQSITTLRIFSLLQEGINECAIPSISLESTKSEKKIDAWLEVARTVLLEKFNNEPVMLQ